jgi:hypothetical protein
MQSGRTGLACCWRCAGPEFAALSARRQFLKAAVFPPGGGPPGRRPRYPGWPAPGAAGHPRRRPAGTRPSARAELPRVVLGTVLDVSPHVLVVGHGQEEERFTLTGGTAVWRAEPIPATALRAGEPVVARLLPGRRNIAGKVWASIGRVTGTIVEYGPGDTLLVDEGTTRQRRPVVIAPRAATRIRVRIPQLAPGNLIDVIGLVRDTVLEAHLPATAQPAYLAGRVNRAPTAPRPAPGPISGSATWHESASASADADGVAYPAIDPGAGCAEHAPASPGRAVLPYLAVGSLLLVRNDCTGAARVLPVTGCGAVAAAFHDRCLACGTSPRGRIAELTMASFVALGGDLERGCFNATIETGW